MDSLDEAFREMRQAFGDDVYTRIFWQTLLEELTKKNVESPKPPAKDFFEKR